MAVCGVLVERRSGLALQRLRTPRCLHGISLVVAALSPVLSWWLQLVTTLPLAGLIWTIQWVHYPLFAAVGATGFADYHRDHSARITLLVAPLMVVELAAAVAAVCWPLPNLPWAWAWCGLALVVLCWGVTGAASVPQHQLLALGFDAHAHAALVRTNWLRTLAWTARAALVVAVLWRQQAAR